jgi:hypothetical protein
MGHCYCEILIIGFPLVDSRNKIGEKGGVLLYTTRVVFTHKNFRKLVGSFPSSVEITV